MLCLSGFELYSRWVPLSLGITLNHKASHSITRHPIASQGITQHHKALHCIRRPHTASQGITEHHKASHCIWRPHTASEGITNHHTASQGLTQHHKASQGFTHHQKAPHSITRPHAPSQGITRPHIVKSLLRIQDLVKGVLRTVHEKWSLQGVLGAYSPRKTCNMTWIPMFSVPFPFIFRSKRIVFVGDVLVYGVRPNKPNHYWIHFSSETLKRGVSRGRQIHRFVLFFCPIRWSDVIFISNYPKHFCGVLM